METEAEKGVIQLPTECHDFQQPREARAEASNNRTSELPEEPTLSTPSFQTSSFQGVKNKFGIFWATQCVVLGCTALGHDYSGHLGAQVQGPGVTTQSTARNRVGVIP